MDDLRIAPSPGSRDGIRVLKLIGPFTLKNVFEFQTAVREQAAPLTIVDLTAVPYMDSAAMGSILGLHVSCQRHGLQYGLSTMATTTIEALAQAAQPDLWFQLYILNDAGLALMTRMMSVAAAPSGAPVTRLEPGTTLEL